MLGAQISAGARPALNDPLHLEDAERFPEDRPADLPGLLELALAGKALVEAERTVLDELGDLADDLLGEPYASNRGERVRGQGASHRTSSNSAPPPFVLVLFHGAREHVAEPVRRIVDADLPVVDMGMLGTAFLGL